MELKQILQKIEQSKKYGDIATACKRAGYSSQVFETAKKKSYIEDLTLAEREVIFEVLKILDETKERLAEIEKHVTN